MRTGNMVSPAEIKPMNKRNRQAKTNQDEPSSGKIKNEAYY